MALNEFDQVLSEPPLFPLYLTWRPRTLARMVTEQEESESMEEESESVVTAATNKNNSSILLNRSINNNYYDHHRYNVKNHYASPKQISTTNSNYNHSSIPAPTPVNRLEESKALFKTIITTEWFKNSSVITKNNNFLTTKI